MDQSHLQKFKLSTVSSLLYQIVTIICGFILPRIFLTAYGSAANGLVSSITQFLQIISFLEFGVGAVVQSALYKPLEERDWESTSKVMASAQKFFRNLARILLVYVLILMLIYPLLIKKDFGWLYTAVLILSISISNFGQYYFGVSDALLLTADQRGYIQYSVQTLTVLLNTAACMGLISCGAGIHLVKLISSLIYLLRPLIFHYYVKRHYKIDRSIKYSEEPIPQKWSGMAQHISAVVLGATDMVVLTLFSTLSNVSIYSVYYLVVDGVTKLFLSLTHSVRALLGKLWAKEDYDALEQVFAWVEWSIHTGTVFIFGCTVVLLVPFVSVYTNGIEDVNYIQPLFALLLCIANAGHCLRLPYNMMILAGGHFRQTQDCHIITATLNIVISVAAVITHGLIGVAFGTLIAMLYQTLWMACYLSKNLIQWPFKRFAKQIFADIIGFSLILLLNMNTVLSTVTYLSWILLAIKTALLCLVSIAAVNIAFYPKMILKLLYKITGRE